MLYKFTAIIGSCNLAAARLYSIQVMLEFLLILITKPMIFSLLHNNISHIAVTSQFQNVLQNLIL